MFFIKKYLIPHSFPLLLLSSIILGGLTGAYCGKTIPYLKPLGDIFLNLILSAIVPLIFFSIAASITRTKTRGSLGKIFSIMAMIFLFTGLVAAFYSLVVVQFVSLGQDVTLDLTAYHKTESFDVSSHVANMLTVNQFSDLLTHKNMLALIIFSIITGLACTKSKEKARAFVNLLYAGEEVFMNVFQLIMYAAPVGFFAYFAVLIHELGPQLMQNYLRIAITYYTAGLLYFGGAFTLFAYLADRKQGIFLFWKSVFLPMITSLATCSSAASIPANLAACKKMGIPSEIYETVIPLGSVIHKDGSVIGGMFKIAFLFGVFHYNFGEWSTMFSAVGVSLLVGMVMGAIPSGGMIGELLILNIYGFPPSVLIAIAAISIIIDPLATMINVTCNTVSTLMISKWMKT